MKRGVMPEYFLLSVVDLQFKKKEALFSSFFGNPDYRILLPHGVVARLAIRSSKVRRLIIAI